MKIIGHNSDLSPLYKYSGLSKASSSSSAAYSAHVLARLLREVEQDNVIDLCR